MTRSYKRKKNSSDTTLELTIQISHVTNFSSSDWSIFWHGVKFYAGIFYTIGSLFLFRKQIQALKFQHKKDVESVIKQFSELKAAKFGVADTLPESPKPAAASRSDPLPSNDVDKFLFRPIGFVQSCHSTKNGSPRQPTVSPGSRGFIDISMMGEKFNNPEYSLQNLEEFSHVWIIFVFHLNDENFVKTKVWLFAPFCVT